MFKYIEEDNLNNIVLSVLDELEDVGKYDSSRNGSAICLYDKEIILTNPKARHLYLNGRTNNIYATWAELFWVFSGNKELDPLMNFILPRAKNYSDDGLSWRGAYGDRIFNSNQIDNIVNKFKDVNTRQAVFSIWQPNLDTESGIFDNYKLESSKDIPCNNFGWFFVDDENRLNLKVGVRSNDVLFGLSAINIAEWTVLHEMVLELINNKYDYNLKLGYYHHSVINLHLYKNTFEQAKNILNNNDYTEDTGELLNFGLLNIDDSKVPNNYMFDEAVTCRIDLIYNILCEAVRDGKNKDSSYLVDKLNDIFHYKNNTTVYYYSILTLLYILHKVNEVKDNLFSDIRLDDIKVTFQSYFLGNPDLDLFRSIYHCKFTPNSWKRIMKDYYDTRQD